MFTNIVCVPEGKLILFGILSAISGMFIWRFDNKHLWPAIPALILLFAAWMIVRSG